MFIRKFLLLIFLVFLGFSLVFAEDKEKMKQAERDIQRLFPRFKVSSMVKLPINEVYEVVAEDGAVIFYSPSGYVILGDIMNLKGESFLAKIYDEMMGKILDTNDGRFFVKVSSGGYRVVAFLSPTNKESKDVYSFLKQKKNLDFYVFPLVFSEDDIKLASYIYCAKDKVSAMNEVFEGKVNVGDVKLDEACQKRAREVLGINLRVARSVMVYSESAVLIGDKRIFGYQPLEIMKALYFIGWREEDGGKGER
jgi:hypothetical protein